MRKMKCFGAWTLDTRYPKQTRSLIKPLREELLKMLDTLEKDRDGWPVVPQKPWASQNFRQISRVSQCRLLNLCAFCRLFSQSSLDVPIYFSQFLVFKIHHI